MPPRLPPPATLAAPAPTDLSAAANFAVLVLSLFGHFFAFEAGEMNMNLAVTFAAMVIFIEVCSLLIKSNDYVTKILEIVKVMLIAMSMFFLLAAFALDIWGKFKGIPPMSISICVLLLISPVPGFGVLVWLSGSRFVFMELIDDLKVKLRNSDLLGNFWDVVAAVGKLLKWPFELPWRFVGFININIEWEWMMVFLGFVLLATLSVGAAMLMRCSLTCAVVV